jgi:hypothetical protein
LNPTIKIWQSRGDPSHTKGRISWFPPVILRSLVSNTRRLPTIVFPYSSCPRSCGALPSDAPRPLPAVPRVSEST